MAEIRTYGPVFRRLRSDAGTHVLRYHNGRREASGRGLAFWFVPYSASIAELPCDDRDLPFTFNTRSSDHQTLLVQGTMIWRVADPESLGDRIDFSIDLKNGRHLGEPIDQIANLLTGMVQQFATGYLEGTPVHTVLASGVKPLQSSIEEGLLGSKHLDAMGIEVVSIRIAAVSPTSELRRAIQTPTFEHLQQQADEATFQRRAMAVEKERAIAENELQSQIELAKRQMLLIEQEDQNERQKAEALSAAAKIRADSDASRIRTVEQARVDMERTQVEIYRDLAPPAMLGLAAREFAGKLQKIDNLSITPEMLAGFLRDLTKGTGPAGAAD